MYAEASETAYKLKKFCRYYSRTWLHGNYSIAMWNYYDQLSDDDPRTNNHAEAQNRHINNKLFNHPHIWKCIEFFKDQDAKSTSNYTKININKYKYRNRKAIDSNRIIAIMGAKVKLLEEKFTKLDAIVDPEIRENSNLELYLLELAQKMVEFKPNIRNQTASVAAAIVEEDEEKESEEE